MATKEKPATRPDLESIYDTEIHPLMQTVAEACIKHGISFVSGFQFSAEGVATMQWIDPQNDDERLKLCHMILNTGSGPCVVTVIPVPPQGNSGVMN
jgi:hypothetical protein